MDISSLQFTTPLALALVAALGYFVGRGAKTTAESAADRARRDLKRAKAVAQQLELIADDVRKSLAVHSASIARFKDRIYQLNGDQKEPAWRALCKEAEEMLKPTLRLATQIAHAYDEIRQQSNQLMSFADVRTDSLTKVSNRRALDDVLDSMFALLNRYQQPFAIVMFDVDNFKKINDEHGHVYGDSMLQGVARLIDETIRDTDLVARYGGEEFVVVLPHTSLAGAEELAERIRRAVESTSSLTTSGGVALAIAADNPQTLLSRADAALYGAKAAGRNCIFRHTGSKIEPVVLPAELVI